MVGPKKGEKLPIAPPPGCLLVRERDRWPSDSDSRERNVERAGKTPDSLPKIDWTWRKLHTSRQHPLLLRGNILLLHLFRTLFCAPMLTYVSHHRCIAHTRDTTTGRLFLCTEHHSSQQSLHSGSSSSLPQREKAPLKNFFEGSCAEEVCSGRARRTFTRTPAATTAVSLRKTNVVECCFSAFLFLVVGPHAFSSSPPNPHNIIRESRMPRKQTAKGICRRHF